MSGKCKIFEKRLDADFVCLLESTKSMLERMSRQEEKDQCEVWLKQLFTREFNTARSKRDRNIYLSRLLLQMRNDKLEGLFLERPHDGALESAFRIFDFAFEVEHKKDSEQFGFPPETSHLDTINLVESSVDGRTYLATRSGLGGMMAFLAVDMIGEESLKRLPNSYEKQTGKEKAVGNLISNLKLSENCLCKNLADVERNQYGPCRRTPEDRERIFQCLEPLDVMTKHCTTARTREQKPDDLDVEILLLLLHEHYQKDPSKREMSKDPELAKVLLLGDVTDRPTEKRAELSGGRTRQKGGMFIGKPNLVSKRERVPNRCKAKCSMVGHGDRTLGDVYPPQLVDRFFELLVQERLKAIEKEENKMRKRIDAARKFSFNQVHSGLTQLKKTQNEYKELYYVYKEVEQHYVQQQTWKKAHQCSSINRKISKEQMTGFHLKSEVEISAHRHEEERCLQSELIECLKRAKASKARAEGIITMEIKKLKAEKMTALEEKGRLQERVRQQRENEFKL